jgi:ribonuclease HII
MPKNLQKNLKFIVGIDEAGRGPLAGPVSVGAVVIPYNKKHPLLKGPKDSKQISEKLRKNGFKLWGSQLFSSERLRILLID